MPNNMISLPLQTEKFGKRNSSEFLKDEHWVCYRTEIKTWGPFVSLQPPCCSIHVCTYPDLQSHTEKLNKMRESMNKRICMSAHGQITQFSTYRRVQVKLKHFHPHLQLKVKILLSCPCSLFLPQIRIKERRDSWSSLRCGGFLLGAGAVIPSSEQLGGGGACQQKLLLSPWRSFLELWMRVWICREQQDSNICSRLPRGHLQGFLTHSLLLDGSAARHWGVWRL